MKIRIIFLGFLLVMLSGSLVLSQTRQSKEFRQAYSAPEEIVSLSSTMSFNQALMIFNDLSKKYLDKIIVDPEKRNFAIGVDVNKMHWMDAFELILKENNLWYEDFADYIEVVAQETENENVEGLSKEEKEARDQFLTREVNLSAIFFETNYSKLREAGMSWDFFRGKDVNLKTHMGAADSKTGIYEIQLSPDLDFGSLLAVFKSLEQSHVGEVVASPQVTVISGQEGRIQVGSDIAITVRDFAGNAVTQFFSTGSIIRVKPLVIRHDSITFINLDLQAERSNTTTSEAGLEIKKSSAKTSVLLLDGEETIIGGLYITEESNNREGIPFLKDLPWWFLGLRYVFGYEQKRVVKNELLILIRAELLPTLAERFENKLNQIEQARKFKDDKESIQRKLQYYKKQWEK